MDWQALKQKTSDKKRMQAADNGRLIVDSGVPLNSVRNHNGSFGHEEPATLSLTPELYSALLAPEIWSGILRLYAHTMKLAVALVDRDGRLVGPCHNPQPIWSWAREARPNPAGACPFCLETAPLCTAIADAGKTQSLIVVHDQAGFAHVALPLTLAGQHVGTLLAGQILDRFPELLPLQRTARDFGLHAQQVWDSARHTAPVSQAHLAVYGELLWALGRTVLGDRSGELLGKRLTETTRALNQELVSTNSMLRLQAAQLDQSRSDMQNLLESSQIATLFLDVSLHLKDFTPAGAGLLGLTNSDVGRHVKVLDHKFAKAGLAERISDIVGRFSMDSGQMESKYEYTIARTTGVMGDQEEHYLVRVLPYRTSLQVIDGVVVTFIDVTDLKRAERLAESAKTYAESIVDTVRKPLLVLDESFRVLSANQSFYHTFQASAADTLGQLLYEVGDGGWNIADFRRLLSEVLPLNKRVENFEMEHDFPHLGVRNMALYARRIDHLNLILLGIEDITERKISENVLRSLNLNLKMFSQAAAHDLQEPLRMIKTSTQMLAEEYKEKPGSQADDYIAYVLEGANRLENLLRDLREYWLVNESTEQRVLVDSFKVLQKTVHDLEFSIKQSNALVTYDPLPMVAAEEVSLTMLFQNLIGNALKYRRPGQPPNVHISARKEAEAWCFSVTDNGIGVEARNLELIFAPFKRLNGKKYPGSGIGLALCEKIVERYRGKLWAESVYGEGSTFYFTIPERAGAAEAMKA